MNFQISPFPRKTSFNHVLPKALKAIKTVKRFPNRKAGILKDPNFFMSPDFDEPLEDFKEYM